MEATQSTQSVCEQYKRSTSCIPAENELIKRMLDIQQRVNQLSALADASHNKPSDLPRTLNLIEEQSAKIKDQLNRLNVLLHPRSRL
jgi:hypothetical protein